MTGTRFGHGAATRAQRQRTRNGVDWLRTTLTGCAHERCLLRWWPYDDKPCAPATPSVATSEQLLRTRTKREARRWRRDKAPLRTSLTLLYVLGPTCSTSRPGLHLSEVTLRNYKTNVCRSSAESVRSWKRTAPTIRFQAVDTVRFQPAIQRLCTFRETLYVL